MNKMAIRIFPLALAPLWLLAGCSTSCQIEETCQLAISLPSDITLPPDVSPRKFHVQGSATGDGGRMGRGVATVIYTVPGNPGDTSAVTELRFQSPRVPFVDEEGQPMATLTLYPGVDNEFRVRPHSDGYCRWPRGCKYNIVNTGTPDRPERDPHVYVRR